MNNEENTPAYHLFMMIGALAMLILVLSVSLFSILLR